MVRQSVARRQMSIRGTSAKGTRQSCLCRSMSGGIPAPYLDVYVHVGKARFVQSSKMPLSFLYFPEPLSAQPLVGSSTRYVPVIAATLAPCWKGDNEGTPEVIESIWKKCMAISPTIMENTHKLGIH